MNTLTSALLLAFSSFMLLEASPHGETGGMPVKAEDGTESPSGISLLVVTGDFRTIKGDLFIELSDDANRVLSAEIHPVTGDTVTVRFDGLSSGRKSVRLFHDENGNGTLDTNFLGIPREGYGFSNNPRSRFGEPSLEDRLFELRADTTIRISLVYW